MAAPTWRPVPQLGFFQRWTIAGSSHRRELPLDLAVHSALKAHERLLVQTRRDPL